MIAADAPCEAHLRRSCRNPRDYPTMKHRELPGVGDSVAYTRDFIMNAGFERAAWRGVVAARHEGFTPEWPLVIVRWSKGQGHPRELTINAHNLCKTRSVAFVESAAPVYSPIP